ncbi:MAG: GNAT family N-acetyltransferase [Anaerolineae bacterium]|nr:GNAT family N-acetyltransferase [Anaerolineae bacterium]
MSSQKYQLRPYSNSDFEAIYALWQATMSDRWQLTPRFLRRMLHEGYPSYQEGDYWVAEEAGRVIGFVAAQYDPTDKSAGIALLMVSPDKQRQGIGTRLHTAAMERLRGYDYATINLAHGGGDGLFPGVPTDPPDSMAFFSANGWGFPDTSYDLIQNLTDYQTPAGMVERAEQQGIVLRTPKDAAEASAVVEFEQINFPFWRRFFAETVQAGRYGDILAAWDGSTVVGSLLMDRADIEGMSTTALWHLMLGDDMGTIGAVGVEEARQGRGIGLALVARASEMVKQRGVRQCVIGWTGLLNFYGKLGYRVWRSYGMTDV